MIIIIKLAYVVPILRPVTYQDRDYFSCSFEFFSVILTRSSTEIFQVILCQFNMNKIHRGFSIRLQFLDGDIATGARLVSAKTVDWKQ